MLYAATFTARDETTMDAINKEREEWIGEGKHADFQQKCSRIERYEVAGTTPLEVFLLVETDDPDALNMITRHFGHLWHSRTCPVIQRTIQEALEEDRTVTYG